MKKLMCVLFVPLFVLSLCSCSENPVLKNINDFIVSNIYIDWDSFSAEKQTDKGSAYKNFFDALSTNQRKAYNNILNNIADAEDEFPEEIEVPLMESEELSEVYEAVVFDNPEIMCFGSGGSIITEGELCFFKPDYVMIPSEQRDRLSSMESFASQMCSAFNSTATDFDKELAIHDYLIKNCVYDCDRDDSSSAYSCIFSGYASCEGYSKATKFLLEKAGIECYTIIGDAKNSDGKYESHMWNIVNVSDNYYYLDTTWDDSYESDNKISHIYFNITEEEIKADHSNFTGFFMCENTDENYFVKTGSLFSGADSSSLRQMENTVVRNLQKSNNDIQFRFDSEAAYYEAIDILISQSKAYTIQNNVKSRLPGIKLSDEINYSRCDDFCVIEFIF